MRAPRRCAATASARTVGFLAREMPRLEAYFHYRNLDVSTLKILAQQWAPGVAKGFVKESAHLALSDIRDSIEELVWYREHLFDADCAGSCRRR